MKYQRILEAMCRRPWAIQREKCEQIFEIMVARAHGVEATKEEIQAAVAAARQPGTQVVSGGAIAVIPVFGTIMHRADAFSDFSGGTSIVGLRKALNEAMANPQVDGILWEFDTPGGGVDMVEEFAAEIAAAKQRKPMMGIANTLSASAGYWLMSQLDEIASTPSGATGSVGVYLAHADWSKWNEEQGIKITYISYGDHKVEGNSDEPLSPETEAYLQAEVDAIGRKFDAAVASGRKITAKQVRETFGGGRVFMAKDALSLGMVDRVATFDQMVERLASKARKASRSQVAAAGMNADRIEMSVEQCATCGGSGLKPERFMSDPQGQEQCPDCAGTGKASAVLPAAPRDVDAEDATLSILERL